MVTFNAYVGRRRLDQGLDTSQKIEIAAARNSFEGILRNFKKFIKNVEQATPEVLYNALEPTFQKSLEYCPKDTGALASSGYLEITSFRGVARVEIGYGKGGSPEYAAKVHENLEYHHDSPTRAKWLQVALEEDAELIQARIVNQLRV